MVGPISIDNSRQKVRGGKSIWLRMQKNRKYPTRVKFVRLPDRFRKFSTQRGAEISKRNGAISERNGYK